MKIEDNVRLTQTGEGTPMGELLRRYWHPSAEGRDPGGVIRNPEVALIRRPFAPWSEPSLRDFTRQDFLAQHARISRRATQDSYFGFYAGQPEEVQKAFSEAFGL